MSLRDDALIKIAGVGPTSLGKAEDAPHVSADTGIQTLGVRYETLVAPVNAANDYTFYQTDDLSKQVVMPYAPPVNQVQGITAAMTLVASIQVLAAGAAGVRNYITDITVTNTSATGTEVDILDGVTVIARIYVPPTATISKIFNIPLKGTAATAVNAQNVTTGSNTYVQITGFLAL